MRTVTYGAACSLDGFIARPDGSVDWLIFTADVSAVMTEFWKDTDTMLMGRKTWDFAAAQTKGGGTGFGKIETYVFSRTLTADPHPDVRLVREDAGAFVRALKARPGKGICVMSGGNFAASLFAAGVIDEVRINVHPVLLGAGIPLFTDPGTQVNLTLTECRPMKRDCLLLSYRVAPPKTRRRRGQATEH